MAIPGAQPQQPFSQQPTSVGTPAYQFNPYAQPSAPPPGPPGQPPTGQGRGGGPRWLWALGGVVVASVTWAATLMATGALEKDTADFRGYRFHHDMCEVAELASFKEDYEFKDSSSDNPDGYSSRQKGYDISQCSRAMTKKGDTSGTALSTYVSTTVEWHKKSDPTGEFASQQQVWEDQKSRTYKYSVSSVDGFGDEAYLVKEERGGSLGSLKLTVRAGWMTYEMRWSWFGGTGENAGPPSVETVTEWLKTDTRAALKALEKPDSKNVPGRDPDA